MHRLLITGANGFIGKYFIEKYSSIYKIKKFSFLKDRFETLDLSEIDVVFHLSALVHQMGGTKKEEYERVNITQTLNLAKKAKEGGVGFFVFMSSVKVYGEESDNVYNEFTECKPQDDYGKSKLQAEKELLKLEDDSFRVAIIRTPIVYGEGVKANIRNLITLVNKVPLLPLAKITNKRSMVYIGNLCHLVKEVIEQKQNGIFLSTDDAPLSTTMLIKLIAQELQKKVYLIHIIFFPWVLKTVKPAFFQRLYGSLEIDNTHTKHKLHLQNPYATQDGIRYMIHGEKR